MVSSVTSGSFSSATVRFSSAYLWKLFNLPLLIQPLQIILRLLISCLCCRTVIISCLLIGLLHAIPILIQFTHAIASPVTSLVYCQLIILDRFLIGLLHTLSFFIHISNVIIGTRFTLLEDSDTLPLTHELFDVDTLTFEDVPGRTVTLVGPAGHGMRVDFDGFDYLGVWSAAGGAPFVALEPWCGTATRTDEDDVFEHKQGMIFLEPGESTTRTFVMRPF